MERRKLFIVITLLLFILFLVVYLIFFTALGRKLAGLYKPRLLESEKDVQDTVVCDPMTTIQKCTNLGDPCIQCKDGLYSCQEVRGSKIIFRDPSGKETVGPVANLTAADGQKFLVPDGKWCLPTAVQQGSPCNTFTSTPIVTKVSDSLYKWRCYCKYPNWVASSGIDADCDVQIACNHQRNPNENRLVYCANGESTWDPDTYEFVCTDGSQPVVWDSKKSQVNLEDTFCQCESDSYYYENKELGVKECVKNPCGAGNKPFFNQESGNLDCKCDRTGCGKDACDKGNPALPCQISCAQLPDEKKGECAIGCIDDPCRMGSSPGYYDIGGKTCTCCCNWRDDPSDCPGDKNGGLYWACDDGTCKVCCTPGKTGTCQYKDKNDCLSRCKKGDKTTCSDGSVFMPDENFLGGGFCEDVQDACNRLVTGGKNSCTYYRGGKCQTCPTKTQYGTFVNTPYCYDCKYQKGFTPDPTSIDCKNPKNCDTCDIWFADCDWNDDKKAESDNACCTGRCNKGSEKCLPCNDPGISPTDSSKDKKSKQEDWDKRCRSYYCTDDDDCSGTRGGADVPKRRWCNSYKIADGAYSDWSSDGMLGFCETEKGGHRY